MLACSLLLMPVPLALPVQGRSRERLAYRLSLQQLVPELKMRPQGPGIWEALAKPVAPGECRSNRVLSADALLEFPNLVATSWCTPD